MTTFELNNTYGELNALFFQAAATAVAVVLLGLYGLVREKGSQVSLAFFVLSSAIGLWLFGFSWMYGAPSASIALFWGKAGYVGIALIPAAVYNFSVLILTDYQAARTRVIAFWMISALFTGLVLATDLQFSSMLHFSWGYYPQAKAASIPLILYFFSVTVITLRGYVAAWRHSPPGSEQKARTGNLLLAFSIAYLGSIDFIASFGVPWYPTSHLPIFVFLVIASRSIFRYRFMAVTPAFAARQIIDTMNDAVIVLDAAGFIRVVNRATCRLFGCREQDLLGRPPSEALGRGIPVHAVARNESVHDQELQVEASGGALRTLSLSTSVMSGPSGEPLITVCVLTDISTRKRAEQDREELIRRLQDANLQLQAVDRMKSEFVSLVSHELRTPLTTIKAFTELIGMKPNMPEPDRSRLLRTITSETDRLARLISDILDLARIESGSLRWRMEDVPLEEVARKALDAIRPLSEKRAQTVTMQAAPGLPPVLGDADRLMQVMTNILSNAVKFTPPGGAISVSLSGRDSPERQVVVAVSDTGIGIPERDMDLIFEKFHRSEDPLTGGTEGTGLGLAIARQIVEHHGGTIRAESVRGKGSTFFVILPVRAAASGSPAPATAGLPGNEKERI